MLGTVCQEARKVMVCRLQILLGGGSTRSVALLFPKCPSSLAPCLSTITANVMSCSQELSETPLRVLAEHLLYARSWNASYQVRPAPSPLLHRWGKGGAVTEEQHTTHCMVLSTSLSIMYH